MDHYWTNNENLESSIKEIKYDILDKILVFNTDLGVFSKDKIDKGSDLLISSYLFEHDESLNILDVGCGYGAIGITLSVLTGSEVLMTDVNRRSIHLAKMNIKKNKCNAKALYSDAYENVKGKYDIIITNPPIRVGNDKLYDILINAKDYLSENGELWYVIRKDQGALTVAKKIENFYDLEIKNKKKGYIIFCGKMKNQEKSDK